MNRALAIVLAVLVALSPASWAVAWGWRRACCCPAACGVCPPPVVCAPVDCCEPLATLCAETPEPAPPSEHRRPAAPAADEMPQPPIDPPVIEDDGGEELVPPAVDPDVAEPPAAEPPFSEPPAAEPPVDEPPSADDSADPTPPIDPDLFDPPASSPVPEMEPEPADEPPAAEPEPPVESPPPAESPAEPELDPLEGLFGESASPFGFEAPDAEESSPAQPPAADDAAPAGGTPPSGNAAPTGEPDSDAAGSSDELDPFNPLGTASAPPEADEALALFDGQPRTWTDASGQHACEARLVDVTARGVVLVRDDGVELRVSYERLSDEDLRFLRERIDAVRERSSEGDGGGGEDLVATRG